MPIHNFMLADLGAVSAAFALFGLVALIPGFVAGEMTNVFSFRRMSPLWKVVASIPLSLSLLPILIYLLGRFLSMAAVWWMLTTLWLAGLVLAARSLRCLPRLQKPEWKLLAVALIWVLVGLFVLIDLQAGLRLYFPVLSFDYSLRASITAAISRTGIPPDNPLFYPGHPVTLRYHYFWQIFCSLADQLGGSAVSARQAIMAGTLWCGLGLLAVTFLYLRFFQPGEPPRLGRRTLIASGLFAVTGLDLLPNLLLAARGHLLPEMEWWNEQITSWVGSVLWVPHHIASLIAGLAGLLVLSTVPSDARLGLRVQRVALAGLAFAGASGCSVYVTLVLALFLGMWVVAGWFLGRRAEAAMLAAAGFLALLLAVPYLKELSAPTAGGAFVRPAVRTFLYAGNQAGGWPYMLINALALPLNYLFEFGFFLLVAVVQFRKFARRAWRLSPAEICAAGMLLVSMLVCTFLRSGVIANNDLGVRGALLGQFVLLLWATEWLDARSSAPPAAGLGKRALLVLFLGLGVAGTLFELFVCRAYPMLSDTGKVDYYYFLSPDTNLGRRTYDLRSVYEELERSLPLDARVQHNPDTHPNDLFAGLYSNRQVVAETKTCGAVFGGDPASCGPIYARLEALYSGRASDPDAVCRDLSIDVLVIKDTDPVWKQRESWVWTRKPLFGNGFARALACRQ